MTGTIWHYIALSILMSIFVFMYDIRYFRTMRPNELKYCELYLLEHMLPDGHPLEFMYKGLPRIRKYPRLFLPCIVVLSGFSLSIVFVVIAVILTANGTFLNKTIEDIFSYICIGSHSILFICYISISELQDKKCFNRMLSGEIKYKDIFKEIEKKWPGFYNVEK